MIQWGVVRWSSAIGQGRWVVIISIPIPGDPISASVPPPSVPSVVSSTCRSPFHSIGAALAGPTPSSSSPSLLQLLYKVVAGVAHVWSLTVHHRELANLL